MNPLVPPPIVAAVLGIAMWAVAQNAPWGNIDFAGQIPLALGLLVIGLAIALAAVASFIAAKTTINPMRPARASHLITSGIFSVSRNPIYVADLLLLTALAVWLGNIFNLLFLFIFFWIMQRFQIAPEERALTQRFGNDYRAYCSTVRRWL